MLMGRESAVQFAFRLGSNLLDLYVYFFRINKRTSVVEMAA